MKKTTMMRIATTLLVAVLLTTCALGATFAKYTTSVESGDSARVAYWGFQQANTMDLTGLFTSTYTDVQSKNGEDVIAPGAYGSTTFSFAYDEEVKSRMTGTETAIAVTGPEVAYTFEVSVVENIDSLIENNKNIQWKLDNGEWGTWDELITAINALDGNKTDNRYEANTLPEAFTSTDNVHTISWQWLATDADNEYTVGEQTMTQDQYDTYIANQEVMDDCDITITITATQIAD